MSVLLNLIYRSNTIPVKIPASYAVAIDKLIMNFSQAKIQSSQHNIKGEKQSVG